MSDFFNDLTAGLNQAIAIERGELKGRKTTYQITPVKSFEKEQIKSIRDAAGMTQANFAVYMGVSKKTVEAWEKGTNPPSGPACRLLELLDMKLEEVLTQFDKAAL